MLMGSACVGVGVGVEVGSSVVVLSYTGRQSNTAVYANGYILSGGMK